MNCDFFVTYNSDDRDWAVWIADELQAAGRTVRLQELHSLPGDNFLSFMNDALSECRQTLGVMSPSYLASAYTTAEWTAAYRQALAGRSRAFVPVKVVECDPAPLLGPIVYVDLVGVEEAEARRRLRTGLGLDPGVRRPPRFPGAPRAVPS